MRNEKIFAINESKTKFTELCRTKQKSRLKGVMKIKNRKPYTHPYIFATKNLKY